MKLFLEIILGLAFAQSAFAQTTQPPTCSPYYPIEHSGPSGTITSPGWPGDYPPNSTCTWFINCGQGGGPTPLELDGQGGGGCGDGNGTGCGPLPKISVHWGDVSMPIHWAEDAGCGFDTMYNNTIPKVVAITEPGCPSMVAETITRLEDLTRSSDYPGHIYVTSIGYVGFYGWPYGDGGTGGTGFEIKYECPEPCEDEKSSKFCKKAEKKGKCKKASVAKKCKKTCGKCGKAAYPY